MILELALAANCRYVLTHNVLHFSGCQQLGIEAITARRFSPETDKGTSLDGFE